MKYLPAPKPKPDRSHYPVFVDYIETAVPLDISDEAVMKIADNLKNIYRESKKDKK